MIFSESKPTGVRRALVLSGGGARGAFQAGAWKFLEEKNWYPDLICGTSVGAINAVAIGSGLSAEKIIQLWKACNRRSIFSYQIFKFLVHLFSSRNPQNLAIPGPLKKMIHSNFDLKAMRNNPVDVVISAVNTRTGRIAFFGKEMIDADRILASAAMPVLCPWCFVGKEPYWDGGIMDNAPILPALHSEANEIIVILLSPVGVDSQSLPRNQLRATEMVFEQSLTGSMLSILADRTWPKGKFTFHENPPLNRLLTLHGKKIAFICPDELLGFRSLSDYSRKQTEKLIEMGYACADRQLSVFSNFS